MSGQNERHTKNASLATFVGQACECPTRKQVLGSAREAAALVAKWMPENSIMCKALVLRILGDIQNDASAPCPCEGLRAELEDAQRLRDKYLGALAASREREQKLREALESAARGMADGSLEDIREFGVRAALAALTEKQ